MVDFSLISDLIEYVLAAIRVPDFPASIKG
jgi:hypothetical protein